MSDRRIPMSAPMVRATRSGLKSQTRRVITRMGDRNAIALVHQALGEDGNARMLVDADGHVTVETRGGIFNPRLRCPYGGPGGGLRVTETWAVGQCADGFKPMELR